MCCAALARGSAACAAPGGAAIIHSASDGASKDMMKRTLRMEPPVSESMRQHSKSPRPSRRGGSVLLDTRLCKTQAGGGRAGGFGLVAAAPGAEPHAVQR